MKSKILIIFFVIFYYSVSIAENLKIQARNITLDKNDENSIFENDVIIQTIEGNRIFSDYAEYNKKKQFIILKQNILVEDVKGNKINADFADYDEKSKTFKTSGKTKITTSDEYVIEGEDIILNDIAQSIKSEKNTIITDRENNRISLQNFEYNTKDNIFRSVGEISIKDKENNTYEFSQIYIDTKKKEILGADIKAYINERDFKINKENKPRIFANSMEIENEKRRFKKSIFTICNYRENDKCPPWTIQSSKMLHDNKKKDNLLYECCNKNLQYSNFLLSDVISSRPIGRKKNRFFTSYFNKIKKLRPRFSCTIFLGFK